MNAEQVLFWLYAIAACGGAIAVVVTQNVVRMAFWLVVSLGSVAGLFFLLHADFVAATQLLIYVGGTAVLLIFGVMLTASGPYLKINTSAGDTVLGAGVGLLFLIMLIIGIRGVAWETNSATIHAARMGETDIQREGYNPEQAGNTARPLGLSLLGLRPDKDLGSNGTGRLSTGYLLPFEIASVHLLVVLVGAAYLARAKRRVGPHSEG